MMSIIDHLSMRTSQVVQAGLLQVLVHRASSQPVQTESGDLIIQRAARERWIRDTGLYPSEPRVTVLLYVHRGVCRFERGPEGNEQVDYVSSAQLIAVAPGCRYRFWVDPKEDLELSIIHAKGAVCEKWWRDLGGTKATVLIVRRRRTIEHDLEEIIQHASSWSERDRAAALCYFQALLNIVAGDQTQNLPARSRGDAHADQCRELIEEQFQTYTSLRELARALALNPDYLTRVYLARYNVSPADHLRRRKMEQASVWLREGERTIEEIAEALDFSDAFAFSKSFKSYSGLAPKFWKSQFKH